MADENKIYFPGFEKPFIVPPGMDKVVFAKHIYQKYGDEIKKAQAMKKYMGKPRVRIPESNLHKAARGVAEDLGTPFPDWPEVQIKSDMLGAGMIGAGDTMGGMGTGIRDIMGEDVSEDRQARGDIRQHVSQENPGSFAAGQALPYFAVPLGAGSKPVGAAVGRLPGLAKTGEYLGKSAVADATITGSLLGAADDEMSVMQGGGAGFAGGLLGKAVGAFNKPSGSRLDPHLQDLAAEGERLGYKFLPSQRTGSRNLQRLEDAMEHNFFMSGGADKITEANQKNANRIVAEALGFKNKTAITPKMINDFRLKWSDDFDALTEGKNIQLGDDFIDTLEVLENKKFKSLLGKNKVQRVINEALDVATENNGIVKAVDYQAMSSELTQAITSAYRTGKAPYAMALEQIKTGLDDAVEQSLGGSTREAFRKLRGDYRVYKLLMHRKAVNEQTGDVNLKTLSTVLRKEDDFGYRRGNNKSDLYQAAAVESGFPSLYGTNSATASRLSIPTTMGAGGLLGLSALSAGGDPTTSLGAAAALPLSLWAGSKYYHSPLGQRHVGKGLVPMSEGFRDQLTQKMGLLSLAAQ